MNSNDKENKIEMFSPSRIRIIMESNPGTLPITKDCLYLVTKATELFVQSFSKEVYKTVKKTNHLDYKPIADYVQTNSKFQFLQEIIPRKITFREYKEIMLKKRLEVKIISNKKDKVKRISETSSSDDSCSDDDSTSESSGSTESKE